MSDAVDEPHRIILDEHSLDLRAVPAEALTAVLNDIVDLVHAIGSQHLAYVDETPYRQPCREWGTAEAVFFRPNDEVDRDTRMRLSRMLDKATKVSPSDDAEIPHRISIDGDPPRESSWGMAYALARAARGRAMACLVVPTSRTTRSRWVTVVSEVVGTSRLHLLSDTAGSTEVWRQLLATESPPEVDFFRHAALAFPDLVFSTTLRFHHFKGSYTTVVPWVVRLLSAVNDHFRDELNRHSGDPQQVIARFAARDLTISPESPQTKRNARAWAQRLVTHDDNEYRCEWHGKREWNVDRVHFSVPSEHLGGKVLIGIFTKHLAI